MSNPFCKVPPREERVYPALNRATGRMELVVNKEVLYVFFSKQEYNQFALDVHAMQNPIDE